MDEQPTWFSSRSASGGQQPAAPPIRALALGPANFRGSTSSSSNQSSASSGPSHRPDEARHRPALSSSSRVLADIDNPMPAWNEEIARSPLDVAAPVRVNSNDFTRAPKSTVWRGKDGSIWSSPSVSAWPPNVPASGPSRNLSTEDWEKSARDHLISEEMSNPHQITWWNAERPYIAFYPKAPLTDNQGILKSLARSKTADDTIIETDDGSWLPRQSKSWEHLTFMLHTIANVLIFAFGSSRFPVRRWKPYPVGWWNAWSSDRVIAIEVVRIQLHHLVAFCASLSYICAIARFETGDPDGWYRRLGGYGLGDSVKRWCGQLRHTWIPLMQDIRRVGTFFDARDIKWPDLIQLYLDSGVPFIIYWGNDVQQVPTIGHGIIPDRFRPSLAQILSAASPPDMSGQPELSSAGLKRGRDEVTLNRRHTLAGTVDLKPLREYFAKRYPSHLRRVEDKSQAQALREHERRGSTWTVGNKDSGFVWEVDEETGTVTKEKINGTRFKELLEDEEALWLVRFDWADRLWHRLPDGTFPSPELVRLRGTDIEGFHDLSDNEWWRRTRSPNMSKSDWEHLASIQNLVCDVPRTRNLNTALVAAVQQLDVECEIDADTMHDDIDESTGRTEEPEAAIVPQEAGPPTAAAPSSPLPDEDAGIQLPLAFDSSESLQLGDWDRDAACSPHLRIRIPSPQACLDRAGFIMLPDQELARFVRTPPLALKSVKGTPPLQSSLLGLGSWTSALSAYQQDWQVMSPALTQALQMGRSVALCAVIPDFVARLAGMKGNQPPPPNDGRADYSQPAPQTWMYSPASRASAWLLIRETNNWKVADGSVRKTVRRASSVKEDVNVPVWILSRVDGQHKRTVVLYHACVVVQILRESSRFRTGEDILKYCAQSAIPVNQAGTVCPAADSVSSPASVESRARARAAVRAQRVLGYQDLGHLVTPYDYADYEEALRQLFHDKSIWLAAVKAGRILARLALEYGPPEDILAGPHPDATELGLGVKIKGADMQEYVDDVLTTELELFIVGGFWQKHTHEPPEFDHVRTFFPRAETWDVIFGSPGWDYEKEVLYQKLRWGYLKLKAIGSKESRTQPLSGNAWKKSLRQKSHLTWKCAMAIEENARKFLHTRSEFSYWV